MAKLCARSGVKEAARGMWGAEQPVTSPKRMMRCEDFMSSKVEAQRPIVTDRRRNRTLDEVANVVTLIMSEVPRLAAVRSTICWGRDCSRSYGHLLPDSGQGIYAGRPLDVYPSSVKCTRLRF